MTAQSLSPTATCKSQNHYNNEKEKTVTRERQKRPRKENAKAISGKALSFVEKAVNFLSRCCEASELNEGSPIPEEDLLAGLK